MFRSLVCSQCWPKGCPKVEVFVYKCPIVILMTAITIFSWDVKTDCKITRFPKAECLLFTMWICYLPFLEHKWRRCLENSLMTLCCHSFKMMWQFHGCLFLKVLNKSILRKELAENYLSFPFYICSILRPLTCFCSSHSKEAKICSVSQWNSARSFKKNKVFFEHSKGKFCFVAFVGLLNKYMTGKIYVMKFPCV